MKTSFSDAITDYIISKIPPYIGLVMLQLDEAGMLLNWFGPVEKYLEKKPDRSMHIEEVTPYLMGMVPPLINPMVLPHVQTNTGHYAEIHIVEDELMHTWMFFVDQTRSAEKLQQLLQEVNEERLRIKRAKHNSVGQGAFSALHLLDFVSFVMQGDHYQLIGNIPVWYKELKTGLFDDPERVYLSELFPFIEVFQYEAAECWESSIDSKVESGIWEEETLTGRRMYLQATAIRHKQVNYLIFRPVNKEGKIGNEMIQKAREQRLTLDQLARTEKQLKRLLQFKDQFVSIVSHDLRSPIGAVIGLSEILMNDAEIKEKMSQYNYELLTLIHEEMHRLLDYNDKLFNWSNLELGNFKLNLKRLDLNQMADYVGRMQHLKMVNKRIHFIRAFEQEGMEVYPVMVDETLFGQALNNLVGNAVKFTPEGGEITLGSRIVDGGIEIYVKDNGIGMSKSVVDELFQGFTRTSTTGTLGEKGTGLGLGIVSKIVEAHQFSIRVESSPGKGSTFIISAH